MFCKKSQDDLLPVDPIFRNRLPGTYVQRDPVGGTIYVWEHTEASGYRIGADTSAKFNVQYPGSKKVKIDIVTSVNYPPIKSFIVTLKDITYNGLAYYKFAQTLESSVSHSSNLVGEFIYYDFGTPDFVMTTLTCIYRDSYFVNKRPVAPMITVSSGSLVRKL